MSRPRLPPGQFLTKRFPVLTYGDAQHVPRDQWSLRVWGHGLVEEITWDWETFLGLGSTEVTRDMHCVTSWSRYDNQWSGVPTSAVWARIEPLLSSEPAGVMLHCEGDYTTSLSLEDFLADDCLFATHHDGAPLKAKHGGPIRLVVPHLYAWKYAKWITGVELQAVEGRGFWEEHGYHKRGDPWKEQRYSYQE